MRSAPQLDLNPVHRSATSQLGRRRRIRTIIFSTVLLATFITFIAPRAAAQDLGEIARQERAKKQNNPAPSNIHVYTNDDLKRAEILTPEDKSRFSATNQPGAQPAPQPTMAKPAQSTTQPASELTSRNADLLIGARPPVLVVSTAPDTTSPPTRNSIRQSAQQQTKQLPARPNLSPKPTMRAKTNPTPATRANVSVTSATSAKSVPARPAIPVSATAPVPAAQSIVTTIPPPIPLDQMPLGDVARYYRAKKREATEANAKTNVIAVPGSTPNSQSAVITVTTVQAPISQPSAALILTTAQLNQMPLGDVARYYRAKQLADQLEAAPASATISASSAAAPGPSTSPYPMTILAAPLASMKSPPARKPEAKVAKSRMRVRPGKAFSQPTILRSRMSSSPPRESRAYRIVSNVPKTQPRYAFSEATSVRVASGDTLWQLARRYLGTGTRWQELLALNPALQDPRRLQVGAQLVLQPPT